MNDNTRKIIFTVLAGLPTMLVVWIFSLYFFGCGTTNSCEGIPQPQRTSIPTLPAATMPAPKVGVQAAASAPKCHVSALNLIGAWVSAGYKEHDPFTFTDLKGTNCTATFKDDVQKLFVTPNLWYDGAPACTTCHYADVAKATKNMDLSSYAGILAGSNRVNGAAKGNDILGGGSWKDALLHNMLYAPDGKTTIGRPPMPLGRPSTVPAEGPVLSVGAPGSASAAGSIPAATESTPSGATATPGMTGMETATPGMTGMDTATPAATGMVMPEVARPSKPGGPGPAIGLTGDAMAGETVFSQNCASCHAPKGTGGVANTGSNDGTVPALNPIDSTLVDKDPKTFATNIDLFLEHGSTPEGPSPALKMPAWGDDKKLTPQQIADVIAYVIGLNPPAPEVARPSNPGGAGPAIDLMGDATAGDTVFAQNCASCHAPKGVGGVANPGSSDGTVPALNPIDPTLIDKDPKTFATNIDLYIEHGSTPEGTSPALKMPAWGDDKKLTPQQIANVIAYVMGLNPPPQDVARPSNPGGAGLAITLIGDPKSGEQIFTQNCVACHGTKGTTGVANPGSTDGTVPALNPIDDTIKNSDSLVFAYNIDLFVEHGSNPEGPSPVMKMPAWGDDQKLLPQQIADVIAYIMSLNK